VDASHRPPDEIVAAIKALTPPVELDAATVALQELTEALVGQDELTVAKYREAAVQALKRKIGAPAKLVDSALAPLRRRGHGALQGETIELVTPEPWPEPVDGAEVLDALEAAVRRYAVLGVHAVVGIALWVVHTHAFDAWWITPRLAVTSPVKRCGKSLILDLLEHLVAKALNVANVTAAAVFRGIERYRPTLLIDEADTFLGDKDELRGILNSGHRRNGSVLRAVGEQNEVRAFSTFAPVAIAMIGRLPDTLADRSIPISMRRKKRDERVERFRADRVGDLQELRSKAARWALDNWDALRAADPEVPSPLHDRERDNWRPLFAIADAAGGDWPTKAREAAVALSSSLADDDEDSDGVVLLGDLRRIFDAEGEPVIFTRLLLLRLCDLEDRPWAEWRDRKALSGVQLARLLRPFGVKPRQVRIGDKTSKGYERQWFEDAFARYLPPSDPKHPKQVNGNSDLRENPTRNTEQSVSGCEEPKTPVSTGFVSGVSGRSLPPGAMNPAGTVEGPPDDKVEV